MEKLNDLEKKIMNERYLQDTKTQTQLSEELGISQVTISRIEKKIIDKFRQEHKKTV